MTQRSRIRRRSLIKAHHASALRLAAIIGTVLFVINHSHALAKSEMTAHRWFSATLGFVIPFATSVYCLCGQPSKTTNQS
ncbi:MAG: nitrate/nitrite transporter NrtS [Cyanobacteria bacterium P01_H01_bin.21]